MTMFCYSCINSFSSLKPLLHPLIVHACLQYQHRLDVIYMNNNYNNVNNFQLLNKFDTTNYLGVYGRLAGTDIASAVHYLVLAETVNHSF